MLVLCDHNGQRERKRHLLQLSERVKMKAGLNIYVVDGLRWTGKIISERGGSHYPPDSREAKGGGDWHIE